MHSLTRISCIVCLAFLRVLPSAHAAQTCTQKFEGLTTCSTFNGVFTSGSALSLTSTKTMDPMLGLGFDMPQNKDIKKSDECRALFNTFVCLVSVNEQPAAGAPQLSASCDSSGVRMKPCKTLCLELIARCYPPNYKSAAEVEKQCTDQSASPDIEFFGTNGVLGICTVGRADDADSSLPRDRRMSRRVGLHNMYVV